VPEYWWLYALLLSTILPSLVNLVIGGASLVRGVPGRRSLLLRFMPDRGGVLKWDRTWIAAVLTVVARYAQSETWGFKHSCPSAIPDFSIKAINGIKSGKPSNNLVSFDGS
jgi:hypothetical protein